MRLHRRKFIGLCAFGAGGALCHKALSAACAYAVAASPAQPLVQPPPGREAMFYDKLDGGEIQCRLCPWECKLGSSERGRCGVRENHDGTYYSLVYGRPCTVNPGDPIEKKPFFHYLPGTLTFSFATAGCNIQCKYCQNWQISQQQPEQVRSIDLPPDDVVRLAKENGCPTIAYTYSEPVIFYEYMYETARAARNAGIGGAMVSNGFIKRDPLVRLCKELTAVKVDLKGFSEKFYHDVCRGELKPVLETLKTLKETGIWFEIVVLVIPTMNDSKQEIGDMSKWIVDNLGPDVPLHFSRFAAQISYALRNLPDTPIPTLDRCYEQARAAGIHYVYVGNLPGHSAENTYCHNCGKRLIQRKVFSILENRITKSGTCPDCNARIPGVWGNPLTKI